LSVDIDTILGQKFIKREKKKLGHHNLIFDSSEIEIPELNEVVSLSQVFEEDVTAVFNTRVGVIKGKEAVERYMDYMYIAFSQLMRA